MEAFIESFSAGVDAVDGFVDDFAIRLACLPRDVAHWPSFLGFQRFPQRITAARTAAPPRMLHSSEIPDTI